MADPLMPQDLSADIQAARRPVATNTATFKGQLNAAGGGGVMQQQMRERQQQRLGQASELGANQALASYRGARAGARQQAGNLNKALVATDEEHQYATAQAEDQINQYRKQKEEELVRAQQQIEAMRQKMKDNLSQIGQDYQFQENQQMIGGLIQHGAQSAANLFGNLDQNSNQNVANRQTTAAYNQMFLGGQDPNTFLNQNTLGITNPSDPFGEPQSEYNNFYGLPQVASDPLAAYQSSMRGGSPSGVRTLRPGMNQPNRADSPEYWGNVR